MKRSRFSEEQITAILEEHEVGIPVAELCRRRGSAAWRCPRPNGCGRWKMRTPS